METPKDKSTEKDPTPTEEVKKDLKETVEETTEKTEGIVDSIKETKEDIVDSIKETKEDFSESISSGVKKTKSFFKRLLIGGVLLSIVAFGAYMLWANWTYSEGTRAGNLIKISKKGYVFKTYEGQLKLGGIDLHNEDEGLSDTWSFSVTDEAVYKKLEKMQGEKVVLRYKQINRAMPWQGDTEYYIYDIE